MANQKQINYLIRDYERVFRLVKEAAEILIDTESVASDVLGRFGPTAPSTLTSALADVAAGVHLAHQKLVNARPDDWYKKTSTA